MKLDKYVKKTLRSMALWLIIAIVAFSISPQFPGLPKLASGLTPIGLVGLLASILVVADVLSLASELLLARAKKPPVEGMMVGRIYRLIGVIAVIMGVAYGFGKLATFGAFFSLFGGMLLGWSLQAPVSGIAAWVLVSLKRPFRPGDRIQFPSLGLVGDVYDTGIMYTMLNQVGGTIGSEEAVGRYILVPNAMLFGQVVINYTIVQESPYMLDEVIVRITYDSDWEASEKILLEAAGAVTGDIIEATGMQPYIRSVFYDYGVYLQLRYNTRVQDRAETAYKINKKIFEDIQRTPAVDLAIPYVYSYRAGLDRRTSGERQAAVDREAEAIRDLPVDSIRTSITHDRADVEQLAESIAANGLLQPVMVVRDPKSGLYDIVAGHLRFDACKHLGWQMIPSIIVEHKAPDDKQIAPAGSAPAAAGTIRRT